jgi:hypothetical protein
MTQTGPQTRVRLPPHPASGTTTTSTCSPMALMKAAAAPVGMSWIWTLMFGYHEDRTPTHDYEPTREDAMAAFAKSWRREQASEWRLPQCHAHTLAI